VADHLQRLLVGAHGERVEGIADAIAKVNATADSSSLPASISRIEDVVDEHQQVIGRLLHRLQAVSVAPG